MVAKLYLSPWERSRGLGCSRIKCLERYLGKRNEITIEWRKLHNNELQAFPTINIIINKQNWGIMRYWSQVEMKSPEVYIRFTVCSSVSVCGTNREQIFRLPKSSRTMVCSLLMPNCSAINLSVSRRSCATFDALSRSFLGFCLSMAVPNVAHPRSLPYLREIVWTIRRHIFCSRLPYRTPAPTFHEYPLQFSAICSRTWCLHVALLSCDTTSHSDYVQLAAVGLHCRSHAVHAVCRFSPCLCRTMRMRAHMRQVAVQI